MLKCRVLGDTVTNQLADSMDHRVKPGGDEWAIEAAAATDYLRR
jgi:hypothetical protein